MSTIVVTGASSGIGRAAAVALAGRGHEIAVVGRNPERTREVADRIGGTAFIADFSRLADVRRLAAELAERYERIDVLANNAGGLLRRREITDDGVEATWQSNVLAPFVLTTELAPRLEGGRVIFTSSVAARSAAIRFGNPNRSGMPWFGGFPAYGAAKRADAMLAAELPRRTGIPAWSFHPGFVSTRFAGLHRTPFAGLVARVGKTPEEGAAPLIHLATVDEVGVPVGTYFDGLKPGGSLPAQALDPAEQAKLWDLLERQAGAVR